MNFLKLEIKKNYHSLGNDVIKNFFNPVLKHSAVYKRAVGFFSSSGLFALREGIFNLIENVGSIKMIISPQLSEEDFKAIQNGFYNRGKITKENLTTHQGDFERKQLNFLSNLVAAEYLKIKIAIIDDNKGFGRFNEKMGLFYDSEKNIIAFSGSMNESANGFTKNYDSIDVFTSWANDSDRVKAKETEFDLLWNNQIQGVNVIDFDLTKIKSFSYDEMYKMKTLESFLPELYEEEIQNIESINSVLNRTFEQIIIRSQNGKIFENVSTGFYDLDIITGGLKKSELVILAARPSMGKTALALNIATNVAARKNNVLIFSLEMSKEQLGKRILNLLSRVSSRKIDSGLLSDEDLTELLNALKIQNKLKIFVDDTAAQTLNQIRLKSLKFKQENEIDLIVIDYIQLIQGSKEYKGNRVQEVSEISRGLKMLARELNVPILAVSQLSRNVEQRVDKRPQLSDLSESGSIEQDADIVMFLYRDEYYNPETDDKNLADLIISKNRNGVTGSVKLSFAPEIMEFVSYTETEEEI